MINFPSAKISIGIPTYNSSKYLNECIRSIVDLKNVDEIIISDDGSSTVEVNKIEKIVNEYKKNSTKIFRFIKNKENSGAFVNKFNLIKESSNDFIYILDSDNIAGKNLDRVIKSVFRSDSSKNLLIQPNTMYQFWEYPMLAKLMSKLDKKYKVKFFHHSSVLNMKNVKDLLILNSGDYDLKNFVSNSEKLKSDIKKDPLIDKWVFWILNCGNFIVNKEKMLNISKKGLNMERSLRSVDAIVFSYLWLLEGLSIKVDKDFYHYHRKRNDSVSFLEKLDSKNSIEYFITKVLNYTDS